MNNQKPKSKPKFTPKRKSKSSPTHNKLKIINYVLLFLVITLSITMLSYYYVKEPNKENKIAVQTPLIEEKKNDITTPIKDEQLEQEIKKVLEQDQQTTLELKPEESLAVPEQNKKNYEEYTEEFEKEYPHETVKKKEEVKVTPKKVIPRPQGKAKIAIIIDDVTMQSQVDSIKNIDYIVNMAFLPPTKAHPSSAKIAQGLPFYLIHFPMEASSFKFEEENTLHVGDSYEKIDETVKRLKVWYPNATYTNNHTGSTFTSHKDSMDKLMRALKKYNFTFLDSRTTAKSVAKEYALKHEVPFLGRNIFLDNTIEYKAILAQLKKAIDIANKTGYSIAIGHPHDATIRVLRDAKELLKDLDVVYVNEMPTY
jgi:polysaccharide deacetylase 2 family uncharacterized protein YibQ